jgi:hypothetical protein
MTFLGPIAMTHAPKWRLPLRNYPSYPAVQSAAFLAGREKARFSAPRCQALKRRNKQPCGAFALRGGKFCRHHSGLLSAAKAEAERYGRPVIIRRRPRKQALGDLGATAPRPEGAPLWIDELGPYQRGRAIEAFQNRHMAPDVWRNEVEMPRYRAERTK